MIHAIYLGGPKHGSVERIENDLRALLYQTTYYRRVGFTSYGKRATLMLARPINPQEQWVADTVAGWFESRDKIL